MKAIMPQLTDFVSKIDRRHLQLVLMLIVMVLLVIGAGAPAGAGGYLPGNGG
jgi:TRAP-type uncharacterized transport system fused permease subunit